MRPGVVLLVVSACAVPEDAPDVSTTTQAGVNMQGVNMQGVNMQGVNMQGVNMQGFALDGMTLDGNLHNARVEKGELVAEHGSTTLRGTALAGAHLYGQWTDTDGVTASIEFRIASVTAESATYDPTRTGNTYLYNIEYQDDAGTWQPACGADADGRRAAIPIAATFDGSGARVATPGLFTFGCTTGVIAKCYRWGYRPWLGGYGGANFSDLHWSCTRMARADYCGDGRSNTRDGTAINVWDRLPYPGPIQKHGLLPPLGMLFEAGWDTGGAVCLSRARWLLDDGLEIASLCPDRLIPPGLLGATVCDTVVEVLFREPKAMLFNESYLKIGLLDLDLGIIGL